MRLASWSVLALAALTATGCIASAARCDCPQASQLLETGVYYAPADSPNVTGAVIDANTLAPLSGATVFIPGTYIGAITDSLGWFTFHPQGLDAATLRVERIGYERQDITLNRMSTAGVGVRVLLRPFVLRECEVVMPLPSSGIVVHVRDLTTGKAPLRTAHLRTVGHAHTYTASAAPSDGTAQALTLTTRVREAGWYTALVSADGYDHWFNPAINVRMAECGLTRHEFTVWLLRRGN